MIILLGISAVTFLGALAIWGTRLGALRRGEHLPYYDYYVLPILRTKMEELYKLHLHIWFVGIWSRARSYLFIFLRAFFLIFRSLTLSIEHRLLALMNAIRGRREERIGINPSAFIGELKSHKEGLQKSSIRPA